MARKELADLSLSPNLRTALQALRRQLAADFDIDRLVLFGSVAWGRPDEESDVDLLIVLNDKVNLETEDSISRAVFDVNLKYDTNLSELIVDRETWDYGLASAMPIHEEIEKRGIRM
jgi:predicted nucleotidyltransferase